MKPSKNIYYWPTIAAFVAVALFLSFNKHSKSGSFNYHSVIWADKAGYNVYLPALFIYDMKASAFPENMDQKTGNGFTLDLKDDKVQTKYPIGVAILQSPFFLLAHWSAPLLEHEQTGYSPVYEWALNIAAVFYLVLGFVLLERFLSYYFEARIRSLVLVLLFATTNLYYYAIDDVGMSHVYSFFLFSAFLLLIKKTGFLTRSRFIDKFALGIVSGLILITRPTGVLVLISLIFLDANGLSIIKERFASFFKPKVLLPIVLGAILIALPQLIYWKYSSGSFIHYSYGEEGFNWFRPALLSTWFEPNNGLFLYTPLFFLIVASTIIMVKQMMPNGFFLMALFLSLSYIFSCWWEPTFGCSYGGRNFVEYLAVFSIPLGTAIERSINKSGAFRILLIGSILVFALLNLKMIYSYDGCFHASTDWDWPLYLELIFGPTK